MGSLARFGRSLAQAPSALEPEPPTTRPGLARQFVAGAADEAERLGEAINVLVRRGLITAGVERLGGLDLAAPEAGPLRIAERIAPPPETFAERLARGGGGALAALPTFAVPGAAVERLAGGAAGARFLGELALPAGTAAALGRPEEALGAAAMLGTAAPVSRAIEPLVAAARGAALQRAIRGAGGAAAFLAGGAAARGVTGRPIVPETEEAAQEAILGALLAQLGRLPRAERRAAVPTEEAPTVRGLLEAPKIPMAPEGYELARVEDAVGDLVIIPDVGVRRVLGRRGAEVLVEDPTRGVTEIEPTAIPAGTEVIRRPKLPEPPPEELEARRAKAETEAAETRRRTAKIEEARAVQEAILSDLRRGKETALAAARVEAEEEATRRAALPPPLALERLAPRLAPLPSVPPVEETALLPLRRGRSPEETAALEAVRRGREAAIEAARVEAEGEAARRVSPPPEVPPTIPPAPPPPVPPSPPEAAIPAVVAPPPPVVRAPRLGEAAPGEVVTIPGSRLGKVTVEKQLKGGVTRVRTSNKRAVLVSASRTVEQVPEVPKAVVEAAAPAAAIAPPAPPPRPTGFKKYGEEPGVRPYEVSEIDYITEAWRRRRDQLQRAIDATRNEIVSLGPKAKKRRFDLEMNVRLWESQFAKAEPSVVEREGMRRDYVTFVRKALSTGKPVPMAVIAQRPEFEKALDARQRYEKGYRTSYGNRTVAVNEIMRAERGFKVKRQDGKAITDEQVTEIVSGVDEFEGALGSLKDLFGSTDITIVHTAGKHPFMSDAGGMYHYTDKTVSIGTTGVRALAHELGHWLDGESGRSLGKKGRLHLSSKRSINSTSEIGLGAQTYGDKPAIYDVIQQATRSMVRVLEIKRAMNPGEKASPEAKKEARLLKVRLGAYWRRPQEVWARLVEQYIAGRGGRFSVDPVAGKMAYWTAEDFAKYEPAIEAEIKRQIAAIRGTREVEVAAAAARPPEPAPAAAPPTFEDILAAARPRPPRPIAEVEAEKTARRAAAPPEAPPPSPAAPPPPAPEVAAAPTPRRRAPPPPKETLDQAISRIVTGSFQIGKAEKQIQRRVALEAHLKEYVRWLGGERENRPIVLAVEGVTGIIEAEKAVRGFTGLDEGTARARGIRPITDLKVKPSLGVGANRLEPGDILSDSHVAILKSAAKKIPAALTEPEVVVGGNMPQSNGERVMKMPKETPQIEPLGYFDDGRQRLLYMVRPGGGEVHSVFNADLFKQVADAVGTAEVRQGVPSDPAYFVQGGRVVAVIMPMRATENLPPVAGARAALAAAAERPAAAKAPRAALSVAEKRPSQTLSEAVDAVLLPALEAHPALKGAKFRRIANGYEVQAPGGLKWEARFKTPYEDFPGGGDFAESLTAKFGGQRLRHADTGKEIEVPRDVAGYEALSPEARAAIEGVFGPVGSFEIKGRLGTVDANGVALMAREYFNPALLDEEAVFHAAMGLALTKGERTSVLLKYGNEEQAYEAYRLKEAGPRGALRKVYEFFRGLWEGLAGPTAGATLERIRTGEVFRRPVSEAGELFPRGPPSQLAVSPVREPSPLQEVTAEARERLTPEERQVERPTEIVFQALDLATHAKFHRVAVEAAERGIIQRTRNVPIGAALTRAVSEGKVKVAELEELIRSHGVESTSAYIAELMGSSITEAARRLNLLSQLKRQWTAQERRAAGDAADVLSSSNSWDELSSVWSRLNNVRRGLLVTQMATAARNAWSQTYRIAGMDTLESAFNAGFQRVTGSRVTADPLANWRHVTEALGKSKEIWPKMAELLEQYPDKRDALLGSYFSDLSTTAAKQGHTFTGTDRAINGLERGVHVLNFFNRTQEFFFRKSVFMGEIDRLLRTRGTSLEETVRSNRMDTITPNDVSGATMKALKLTFAEAPRYGTQAANFIRLVNNSPLTFLLPFPRFLYNSMKFHFEYPFAVRHLMNPRQWAEFMRGNPEMITKGLIGASMLGAAYLIREENEGTKWYEITVDDRTIDLRPFNPFSAYLFAADVLKRYKDGTLNTLTAKDVIQGTVGVNFRAGLGLYAIDSMFEQLAGVQKGDRSIGDIPKAALGEIVSGLLVPLKTASDLLTSGEALAGNDEALWRRQTRGEPFLGPIRRTIPQLARGLPPSFAPTKPRPIGAETEPTAPAIRQLTGFFIGERKNYIERELDRLQFTYQEVLRPEGIPEFDNLIAREMGRMAEERLGQFIRSAGYRMRSERAKGAALADRLKRVRAVARAAVLREHPEFKEERGLRRLPRREYLARQEEARP